MDKTGKDSGEFVLVGKVTKAHGIRGELKVFPFSGDTENVISYYELFLSTPATDTLTGFKNKKSRVQGNQVIVSLEGCTSRNQAEELIDSEVWISRENLPELGEGEYYLHQLLNKAVVSEDGERLGEIITILDNSSQNLLVIVKDNKEYLVPLVEEFLVEFDDTKVVLRLPPGLLDINT